MYGEIETGPIRPPSEADSILLRVTRNCPWNRCKFCKLYKTEAFSVRPPEEIRADIDRLALCGPLPGGGESVFLQDANIMALSFDRLRGILDYLREKLPRVKRVTSYGRADSLAKFSVGQLAALKAAGLSRIHTGYESGCDRVLALIDKGYTKAQELETGQKVKAAGLELSVYFMPGVGGRELSEENASETADVISRVNPDFVRIRTFVALRGTGLMDDIDAGRVTACTDLEKLAELRRMISQIRGADGLLLSDHIINLFEDISGRLDTDRDKMLSVFAAFEGLEERERHRYQIARRLGLVRSLSDWARAGSTVRALTDEYLAQLDTPDRLETFLSKRLRRYV